MAITERKPKTYQTQIGWCRAHEGMHQRTAECVDYRYPRETGAPKRGAFDFSFPASKEDRERFERIRKGEK